MKWLIAPPFPVCHLTSLSCLLTLTLSTPIPSHTHTTVVSLTHTHLSIDLLGCHFNYNNGRYQLCLCTEVCLHVLQVFAHISHCIPGSVHKECVYKNVIMCVRMCVRATRDHGVNLFPSSPLLPSTLHPPPQSHPHRHTNAHTAPSSQRLGPRVNGCSTFPLSRSAKNYLLNDVCINIIYMVISLLLITAGPSAARGVG